jgi:hypothetical protein
MVYIYIYIYICKCKKHNDHLNVLMEFVVVLVVHGEDISLTKTHTNIKHHQFEKIK